VNFLSAELAKWDSLRDGSIPPPELLALPFFADERPLRGAAGLVDWRLCGRLSRLLSAGRVSGARGEATLVPTGRLPFAKLLLYGLGDSERFSDEISRAAMHALRDMVARLGVRRWALPLPGRSTGRITARRAVELWLHEPGDADVWLVEAPAGQKEMSEALRKTKR
jgi:hypothetical protein